MLPKYISTEIILFTKTNGIAETSASKAQAESADTAE